VELSYDGTSLVIGWPLFNGNEGEMMGMAEVMSYSDGKWERIGEALMGQAAGDLFGGAVSIPERGDKVGCCMCPSLWQLDD